MATPFLIGCGVAAAAYATRGALTVGQMLAENPNTAKTAQAAAAGFRAVGNRFKLSSIAEQVAVMRGGAAVGFDASMSRSEAAKILGLKENAAKPQIKEAHRKMMLLNHPDRRGSPYIASKINAAAETLMGADRSSGSAFS